MAKANLKEIRNRSKYINEQKHPTLDLLIFNYNQNCQFARAWDKYTTLCRGLITDPEGNIVSRPFSKFFNYGQDENQTIPTDVPIITEKMDGSLGIQYYDGDKVCIATRGSFTSDQAIWATNWIQSKGFKKDDFVYGKTYLYEILYKENRIVVDYGSREELVLLAVIDNDKGDEEHFTVEKQASVLNLSFRRKITGKTIQELIDSKKVMSGNEEGYVFHWPNHKNLRLKMKGDEYLRLHKLLTEFSSISIWEILKEKGQLIELLEKVPDEFFHWVEETQNKLIKEYEDMFNEAKKVWLKTEKMDTQKEKALYIQKKHPDIASLVFAMLGGKDPSPLIWKRIRPKFEKPFTKDADL